MLTTYKEFYTGIITLTKWPARKYPTERVKFTEDVDNTENELIESAHFNIEEQIYMFMVNCFSLHIKG